MAMYKEIKFNQLIEILALNGSHESMIIKAMKSYFLPKALTNEYHYISFGIEILISFVSAENSNCVKGAEKMMSFIKKQVKKVMKKAVMHPSSREKTWKCLTKMWKSTKSLIETDSDVEFSEFASWLLKSIIDFGAENRCLSLPSRVFDIEENLSFIDDHLSGSISLEVVMKLKSIIKPKYRKFKEVVEPTARYVFKYQSTTNNIEKFLKVAFLARIILNESRNGSKEANNLLHVFFMTAVLPPDFFPWAQNHLNMQTPNTKRMQKKKILQYILENLDGALVHNVLYPKNNETKFVDVEPKRRNLKMMESKKKKRSSGTIQQNVLKMGKSNLDVIFSSSGPIFVLPNKISGHKKIPSKDSDVNMTKSDTKLAPSVGQPHKKIYLERHSESSDGRIKSSLDQGLDLNRKDSTNCEKFSKEKNCKRKRRQNRKRKTSNRKLESVEPSLKKSRVTEKLNSNSSFVLENREINISETLIQLQEKPKSNIKNISKKRFPLVGSKNVGNDTETGNILKPIILPNKGSAILQKKNDLFNILKDNKVEKNNGKRKREKTSPHKVIESNSQTSQHNDKANDNDECNTSNKNNDDDASLNKLDVSAEQVGKQKKCRRTTKHSKLNKNNKTICSESKIIVGKKVLTKKLKKDKELEVDEASGSDSDIVPNDLENSMFTKEETRAYHQLQMKRLEENEKRQKMNVIFGKVVNSEISDSNGKFETDQGKDKKFLSKCSLGSQDIVVSSLYKKIDKNKIKKENEKLNTQTLADEENLPYGDDKIEDLEVVFSTIKKDLKTKFICDVKKELPSEEDTIFSIPVKECNKHVKKKLTNNESHPDNVFNIYSKNDNICIISCSLSSSNCKNKVKQPVNSLTKELTHDLGDQLARKEKNKIEEGPIEKLDNSLIDKFNVELTNNDQKIQDHSVQLDKPENGKVDGLTGSEIQILDTSHPNLKKSEYSPSKDEVRSIDDPKGSEKSFTLTLDESSEDVCTNKSISSDEKEGSFDNIKLSKDRSIAGSIFNDKVIKEKIDTFEIIDCSIENTCNIPKEIAYEEDKDINKSITSNTQEISSDINIIPEIIDCTEDTCNIAKKIVYEEDKDINKTITSNTQEISSDINIIPEIIDCTENTCNIPKEIAYEEDKDLNKTITSNTEENSLDINIIPDKISDALLIAENSRPRVEILSQNATRVSSERKKNKVIVGNEEISVDDSVKPKSPHRKALIFEVPGISSEPGSEMPKLENVSEMQNQNKENSENKENIVNNKQEEIVELSFALSNSIKDALSVNENYSHSFNESPKIKIPKYKSPAKRKSFVENSLSIKNNVICLTPLKVASAALSNEIIISPDVSDEENTAKAINAPIEEENNILSISESIVTLNQVSHEEEQIREENDHSNSSHEDESQTQILKEKDVCNENEHLGNSSSLEVLELSPLSTTSSQSKQSPKLALPINKFFDLLGEGETSNNSTISSMVVRSYATRKSPLVHTEKSLEKDFGCTFDENIEIPSIGSTVPKKTNCVDNNETSKLELESEEELESKDKVPSPIKTRYSLRRPRNIATPEKEILKPVRRRRNSASSVKSENEIEVVKVCSPSAKSKRFSIAGNLTPVRRSRRISGISLDES